MHKANEVQLIATSRGDIQGYRMQEMFGMDKNICGRSGHNIIRQVMNSELTKSVWQVISVRDEMVQCMDWFLQTGHGF